MDMLRGQGESHPRRANRVDTAVALHEALERADNEATAAAARTQAAVTGFSPAEMREYVSRTQAHATTRDER